MLYFHRVGFLGAISLGAAALILLPILAVLGSVFGPAGDTWAHLARTALGKYVVNTTLLVLLVAVGVVSIGVLSAWLVTAYRFPGQRVLEWALVLPLAMPAYVMAYVYTDSLQFIGPLQTALRVATGWQAREYWFPEIRSVPGAAVILALALYPYVYLLARTAFRDISRSALEAGRLAGLSAWGSFRRVALPIARPAIAAGAALALMETLADFGTVSYFALEVFTTGIFKAWLSMGDVAAAGQLSACLLVFVFVVLALERANRGRAAYASASRKPSPPQQLTGVAAGLACLACALPVLLGFVLPSGLLIHLAWSDPAVRMDLAMSARLFELIGNSSLVAGFAAVVGAMLATAMAYAARLSRGGAATVVSLANSAAALGYAIPGAVIAVGVLVPLGRLDNWIAGGIEAAFGMKPGLLLTGTVVALVYAYLVRFLAVALHSVEAGLARVTPRMDDAARSLGATPMRALARVHAPLLAPTLASAALLLFVEVMKELPATFALRPFNFDTLAIEAYKLAKDERLAEAALPSLVIVAIGLVPLLLVSKHYFQSTRS
ncbi:MAG: iron ABC transporter permease [Betaproteobacteria bacterium]|nr:iron ABC transporter permease [Betaproteobacteria bacterium]